MFVRKYKLPHPAHAPYLHPCRQREYTQIKHKSLNDLLCRYADRKLAFICVHLRTDVFYFNR